MSAPDPDAVMVQAVLHASDQPMTTELLLSAARAYAALRSAREREQRRLTTPATGRGTTTTRERTA